MKKFEMPAPLWKRALAYVLDMILINIFIIAPFNPIFKDIQFKTIESLYITKSPKVLLALLVISLLTILYFTILEFKLNQTLGKILLNIRLIPKKLKFSQALLRNITKPFILLLILDTLYILISKEQRYTEKLSNTKVVQ